MPGQRWPAAHRPVRPPATRIRPSEPAAGGLAGPPMRAGPGNAARHGAGSHASGLIIAA
jgi:hypothetical protein